MIRTARPHDIFFACKRIFASDDDRVFIRYYSEVTAAMKLLIASVPRIMSDEMKRYYCDYLLLQQINTLGDAVEEQMPLLYLPTYGRYKLQLVFTMSGLTRMVRAFDQPNASTHSPEGIPYYPEELL